MFWAAALGVFFHCHFASCIALVHQRSIAPTTCTLSPVTTTINSQADVTGLSNCVVIEGSILLSSSVSGSIAIDGPQTITGDLIASGAKNLTVISSGTLTTILGQFGLLELNSLGVINFPKLIDIGIIIWSVLPSLFSQVIFGGSVAVKSITISSTSLLLLPDVRPTNTLDLSNNTNLRGVNVKSANISTLLSLVSNGGTFSFPNLTWSYNIIARDGDQLNLPVLTTVNGSFEFSGMSVASIDLRTLRSIGSVTTGVGDFRVTSNPAMTNFSLSLLQSIGGALQMVGNPEFEAISLPSLQEIGANSVLSGEIYSISMPKLASARGGLTIATTNSSLSCSGLNPGVWSTLKGNLNCSRSASADDESIVNATSDSQSLPKPGISTGTKIGVGVTIPAALIMAGIFFLAWKARKREQTAASPKLDLPELGLGGHHERTEWPIKKLPRDLSAKIWSPIRGTYELYGDEQYQLRNDARPKTTVKSHHYEEVPDV